jgi:hypothetical protein
MDISSIMNGTSQPSRNGNSGQPDVDSSILFDAINSATLDRVQQVLREICTEDPVAFKLACDKLLVGQGAKSQANSDISTKRKREGPFQRYEICEQCEEEYDVLDNPDDACIWHPGKFNMSFFIR